MGLRLDPGVDNNADEDYDVVAAGVTEVGRDVKAVITSKVPVGGSQV